MTFSKLDTFLRDFFTFLLFMLPAVVGGIKDVNAKEPVQKPAISAPIEIIGKTDDKKYNIYKLEGEVNDIRWFSNGNAYNGADLAERMEFIKPEDAQSSKYNCAFVCKDKANHVVGLNPAFAPLYSKKK